MLTINRIWVSVCLSVLLCLPVFLSNFSYTKKELKNSGSYSLGNMLKRKASTRQNQKAATIGQYMCVLNNNNSAVFYVEYGPFFTNISIPLCCLFDLIWYELLVKSESMCNQFYLLRRKLKMRTNIKQVKLRLQNGLMKI